MLRGLFNRHKWHTNTLKELVIVIRHRGAEQDRRAFSGFLIHTVAAGGLGIVDPLSDEEDGSWIPYHRVLEVRHGEKVIWRNKKSFPFWERMYSI